MVWFERRAMFGMTTMGSVTRLLVREPVQERRHTTAKQHHPCQHQTDAG